MHFLFTSVLLCSLNMKPCNRASCIMIKVYNGFSLIYVKILLEFTLQLSVFLTTGFNCKLIKLLFELKCPKPEKFEGFFCEYLKFDACYPMSVFKILLPRTGVRTFPV